jgi:CHAT domain-containing protein
VSEQRPHLTDHEIRECAGGSPGDCAPPIEAHLSECRYCLDRLLQLQRTQFHFLESDGMNSGPHPDCPEESLLREIAAEQRPADEYAEKVLHHAAQCSHCGPILSRYLNEFSDELVGELQGTYGDEPAWQNSLARELAESSRSKIVQPSLRNEARNVPRFPVWAQITAWAAPIAAVAVLAVAFGPGMYAKLQLHQASTLVAQAGANDRHTEMRLPDVPYGGYKPAIHELGGETNSLGLNQPELAKATGILSDHQQSSDPRWARVEGRIALLKGADKQAEDAFDRAKAEGLADPGLEIDLAATYFERDSRSDNPNLGPTIDVLNHVLKNPKLTAEQRNTALFDLAIAYEKSNMLDMAAETWTEYLKSDNDRSGGWYKEAEQRLNDLKKKLPPPRASDFRQPGYLLRHLDDPEVQNDIEQFQDFALAHWLPDAFKNPGSDSARALHAIAELMEKQHGDTWWRDFLRTTTSDDLPAIEAASAAFLSSDNDLHNQAQQQAKRAAELFRMRKNVAGELLASFANVYALQRSLSVDRCSEQAKRLASWLQARQYRWLMAQTALEHSICANLASDFATSSEELARSAQLARQFNFPELGLRDSGISAGMQRLRGNPEDSWQSSVAALREYWKHSYSFERLYQFYAVMHLSAANLNMLNTAEALLRHSIAVLHADAPDDKVLTAHLELRLAELLYQQNDDKAGEKEMTAAALLLRSVSSEEAAAKRYYAISVIELAGMHLTRGRAQQALAEIEPLGHVLESQDDFVKLDYYRALGSARLELGELDKASAAFSDGIQVADSALPRLREDSERVAWVKSTDELYRSIVLLYLKQNRDADALRVWEWSRSRSIKGGEAVWAGAQPVPIDLNRRLPLLKFPAHAQRAIYAVFPSRLQIWFVDGDRMESRSLSMKKAEIEKLVQKFLTACSVPETVASSKADEYGEQLFGALIAPIQDLLNAREPLVIETDDPVGAISFEAVKSPQGWYMDDRYLISYSPGVQVEEKLRSPSVLNRNDHFLLADASSASGSAYLPGHPVVVNAVQRLPYATSIVSTAQTSRNELAAQVRSARAMVFFGHGRPYGTGTALELSPGVLLTTRDLSPVTASNLTLVFLAACSTSASEGGLLDSRSLVRTFFNDGVPAVIASRWNVDSSTTASLVEDFLHAYPQASAPIALRHARLTIRKLHAHPYYWAAFSITGRTVASR